MVTPRDAATVILLREAPGRGQQEFEVLMVLRHPKSMFVPNSYVFPGGVFEKADYTDTMERFCAGIDGEKARAILENLSSPEIAIGAWVAGIRETFEEVGLLLAYRDGSLVQFDTPELVERFRVYRKQLNDGIVRFEDLLRREGLALAADRLYYFSHWITPEFLPLRYDVRFFVTRAPAGQEALHDGVELTKHAWITPRDALRRFAERKCNMVLPTLMTMEELSRYRTIDEVIQMMTKKQIAGVLTTMIEEDGEIVEYMPDGRAFRGLPPSVE